MTDRADTIPRTTIGQLVYTASPRFSFARLVADLDSALSGCGVTERRLTWDHDDVAILDIGGARIGLCLAEDLGREKATAVTVAVGFAPVPGDDRLARQQRRLAGLIAERISNRFPPSRTVWTESEETAGPDLFDRLNDCLALQINAEADAKKRVTARRLKVERRRRLPEQQDVSRILARIDATIAARQAGLPDPGPDAIPVARPGEPANREPDLPRADRSSLHAVRAALYAPDDPAEDQRPSAKLRLAAHAMDATLMVVFLPVGAAVMAYGLARGADLKRSARMLALGGIWTGALSMAGGLDGLGVLIGLA
ncbi:hypothetical protein ruthe_00623 [Rubellimicrobium thermophilum DSM 16684]|uniref:Uncharacterized protein n=1 Tax=Rubellimicrobium thermophilum DSM 16684 TaxID=1123069 RepID=S9R0R3_9RHOB|nr:hypothetical protein [Rubellimicrobium thermophilum]EPX87226.1 hypothetical protein ruthe_00623 [Rubellimicrobium thermophilum DSM 16684]